MYVVSGASADSETTTNEPWCSTAADGVMDANQARAPAKRLFCGVELEKPR